LNLGGGALTLDGASGSWVMAGGTISGGTLNLTGGTTLLTTAADGRLSGVTVNGNIALAAADALLRVAGVVTLNGVASLSGSNARLLSEGNTTINTDGGGEIVFAGVVGSVRHLGHAGVGTLTLGPGLLVHGGRANLGQAHFVGGAFSLTNRGTILADVNGQTLTIAVEVNPFVNLGTLRAQNGGSLVVNNLASSPGVLVAGTNGTITVNGNLPLSSTSTIEVRLAGTGPTQFGRINITGTATLDGSLNVIRESGYIPSLGNRFRFMTFVGRSGVFATTGGFTIGGGLVFNLDTTDATDLELVVENE
jgi:hypothetical protein